MSKTVTLYRPVGHGEFVLIKGSNFEKFPPRLPEQSIFYPVTTEDYAVTIARDWNAKQDGLGYVLEFKVEKEFLETYETHTVGSRDHQEYWIPAEKLEEFNDAIIGKIKLSQTFQRWHVYILKCADDTLYTGITNDLKNRIQKHNEGKGAKYTKGRGPVALVRSFICYSKGEALKLEHKIKKLSREEKLNYFRKD